MQTMYLIHREIYNSNFDTYWMTSMRWDESEMQDRVSDHLWGRDFPGGDEALRCGTDDIGDWGPAFEAIYTGVHEEWRWR